MVRMRWQWLYMAVREDSVSATNCLFTLTSPRGRRLSHRSRRLKRFCLGELTALCWQMTYPTKIFWRRKRNSSTSIISALCCVRRRMGNAALAFFAKAAALQTDRLFSRLWLGVNEAASTVSWSSPRWISLATASIISAPEAFQGRF